MFGAGCATGAKRSEPGVSAFGNWEEWIVWPKVGNTTI